MKQGLTPCEDDKPKDDEITLFKASSDYYFSDKASSVLVAKVILDE